MTRLIQSGLIKLEDLKRKYQHELHANEIVLLAYYIATINIENAFHDMTPEDDGIGTDTYIPFEGIVLTDTFQLGETEDGNKIFSEMFPQNSERVKKQVQAPLRVILGNPPYSVGQKSANDNAQNQTQSIDTQPVQDSDATINTIQPQDGNEADTQDNTQSQIFETVYKTTQPIQDKDGNEIEVGSQFTETELKELIVVDKRKSNKKIKELLEQEKLIELKIAK
jgi:predicted helicase